MESRENKKKGMLPEAEKERLHAAAVARGKMKEGKKKDKPLDIIENFAAAGLNDYQFALCLRMTEKQWKRWKGLPEVQESLKIGQSRAKEKVERALFRRAIGYTVEEVSYEDKLTKSGEVVPCIKRTVRDLAPEPIAALMWLTNKFPDEWKNRQDIESRGFNRIDVKELPKTAGELAAMSKALKELIDSGGKKKLTELAPERKS